MKKLVESSGTVAFEQNNVVTLVRQPAQWTTIFLFVCGLITLITLVNGILQLVVNSSNQEMKAAGYILTVIGILFLSLIVFVMRYRKKKMNAHPLSELEVICAFDFNSRKLLDNNLHVTADLSEVRLRRAMQLTSSSPSLSVTSPKRTILLVKGNPFSGGVSAIQNLLVSRGIRMN